jgi:hypothetical protein
MRYCKAYDPEVIQKLLKAILSLLDFVVTLNVQQLLVFSKTCSQLVTL